MSMAPLIAMGFGLVVIGMAFLVIVFIRAYRDRSHNFAKGYRVVAAALALGSLGVGVWAINPLSQALGGPPLTVYLMVAASFCILLASGMLIGSTAIGGDRHTLGWFITVSSIWVSACLIWGYVL